MLFCSCQHNQHRGKSQPAYSWYLTLNMTNRDNETDETKVGWRRQRENGSQGTICWYELNHTVVHKTWLSKGRSGNRGRRFSATWNSEAQMELLTRCFNTIVFYQLLTVADERGKKGQVTKPAETFHFLLPARSTQWTVMCVGTRTN